jgi:hypothetical protein
MKALSGRRVLNLPNKNRLVARGIRDVLRQHGDIFSMIGPCEVRAQLVARLSEALAAGKPALINAVIDPHGGRLRRPYPEPQSEERARRHDVRRGMLTAFG